MYIFLACVLLIGLGFVVGTGFAPGMITELLSQSILIAISAYVGIRFSLYQQRKDEFYELRSNIARWISLVHHPGFWYFTADPQKDETAKASEDQKTGGESGKKPLSLTEEGYWYLFQLQPMLGVVQKNLRHAGHRELADAVWKASRYYSGILASAIPLYDELDLLNEADDMSEEVALAKPNPWSFCRANKLFSSALVDRFTIMPTNELRHKVSLALHHKSRKKPER